MRMWPGGRGESRGITSRGESHGITLIELICAMSVLAILASIALPGFSVLLQDTGRSTAVNGFLHSLFLARSEAIKRGSMVTICASMDGQQCSGDARGWHRGWIVFANDDFDIPPERDREELLLWVHAGWREGAITSNRASFSLRSTPQGVINGTVVFCDPRGSSHARAVIVNNVGRPRLSQLDSSNRPLQCPQDRPP